MPLQNSFPTTYEQRLEKALHSIIAEILGITESDRTTAEKNILKTAQKVVTSDSFRNI